MSALATRGLKTTGAPPDQGMRSSLAGTRKRIGPMLFLALTVLLASACESLTEPASLNDPGLSPDASSRAASCPDGVPPLQTNTLGMTFAWIPPGKFQMGSPASEEWRRWDERLHRVEITRPFYLGVHEVTVGQFRQFVRATGYRTEAERSPLESVGFDPVRMRPECGPQYSWRNPGFAQGDDHPVVLVSWNDAMEFCRWLSEKEGQTYRLPTEAEWEYACRAGTTTQYSGGNDKSVLESTANIRDGSPYSGDAFAPWSDGYRFTSPVGHYAANDFGLHDMHGNVWEWCSDWYDAGYGDGCRARDPQGPSSGEHRVVRGGSFDQLPAFARSANRAAHPPGHRDYTVGFRIVRLAS